MSSPDPAPPDVPPVVAVLVTHDPGPWLEETLTALAAQDYPNLSVLVIDAGSTADPTSRIAAVLPGAFIRRLDHNPGYAAAANEVIGVVEGASHFAFLHDDAAPDPDAIRLQVEEAYRSNAGVIAPKLVRWDDPSVLLAVGMTADKSGVTTPFGRDELDQEQHDGVRDVFVAPGGCTLVRADLFATLGGFDPAMTMFGEDLDLSWRAQVLGARVVVAPNARVRHLEATSAGRRPAPEAGIERLERRHRMRTVLKCYGLVHFLRVVPQVAFLNAIEVVVALVTGQRRQAGVIIDSWRWNLRQGGLRAARRATQQQRAVTDADLRRLQARGSARFRAAVEGGVAVEERTIGVAAAGRELAGSARRGGLRLTLTTGVAIAAVLALGTRSLLGGAPLPAVGQLAPFPGGPSTLLSSFLSGWRTAGLGSTSPAPVAFALLGLAGVLLGGAMGVLQKLLVLGCLPLGVVGAFRLTGPIGSWRARLVTATLYAANPLPYNALARGRLDGLVAYAAVPWILGRLLRATEVEPFGALAPLEDNHRRRRARRAPRPSGVEEIEALLGAEAAGLDPVDTEELRVATGVVAGVHGPGAGDADDGFVVPAGRPPLPFADQWPAFAVIMAITAAFAPPIAAAVLVAAIGLLLGCLLAGEGRAGLRVVRLAGVGVATAIALLVPWSLDLLLPGTTWNAVLGFGRPAERAFGLGALVRFDTGPLGRGALGWAPFVAALLPLLIARRWRLTSASRLWVMAVTAWLFAWAAGRGWLGVSPPAVDAFLMPAAIGLAVAGGLGMAAFESDLPGYRFGWRQVASLVALAAAVVALVPVIAATPDGRWKMPRRDHPRMLGWMHDRRADGFFRVLWVGQAEALPLTGWSLDHHLAYATSRDGPPDVTSQWPPADSGTSGLLADALVVARRGETSRLGHLLAPMAVRYIAVATAPAPGPNQPSLGVAGDLTAALEAQTDLRQVETESSLRVYENAAWGAGRELLPGDAVGPSRASGPEATRALELAGARAVLRHNQGPADFTGPVPAGQIFVSEASSPGWRLDAGGHSAPRRHAFGWANAFAVSSSSAHGRVRYQTPPLRYVLVILELLAWAFIIRRLIASVRHRRAPAEGAPGPERPSERTPGPERPSERTPGPERPSDRTVTE